MDQNSLQPKKLRNPPVTILTEILRVKAKLDEDLVSKHNKILQSFLSSFIPEMKKRDELFDSLYRAIYYTGSYYSNLRVSEPNEFDLNLLLYLPFESQNISVEYQPQVPSYVKYRITDETKRGELITLFENGFLIPDKVRTWFQSVVDKALETYKCPRRLAQVKCSASGPARTIILVKKDGSQIDIDLVPVIECSMDLKPPGIDSRVYKKFSGKLKGPKIVGKKARATLNQPAGEPVVVITSSEKSIKAPRPQRVRPKSKASEPVVGGPSRRKCKKSPRQRPRHRFPVRCFLVPKPYNPSKQPPVNDIERARLWRAHYPKAEEIVIHNLGCVKPLIKLLKLLRDKEDWKILASYYLKTVVMWMIIQKPSKESWGMEHLGDKFLEALTELQSCVERKRIPYFFNSNYNLLEKLSDEQASNIQNRLCIIIRDIKRDNENLWDVFDCRRTFQVG